MSPKLFPVRAALIGFGEVNTPMEFLTGRCHEAANALRKHGIEVLEAPIVRDDPDGKLASDAIAALQGHDFDALVVCVAGWIPSWAVVKTIEPFKHKPILLWGLSGWYENGHFVTTADQAGTTALRHPLREMGFNLKYLVNFKDSPPRDDEAAGFIRVAAASRWLRQTVIGMCGYRDMRLYGTMYDGTALRGSIGPEIEHIDLLEIQSIAQAIPAEEITAAASDLQKRWRFTRPPQPGTVENSVRLALAFQRKILERGYQAFSFCDVDGVKKLLQFAPAGAMTYLHDLVDIPTVPENDSYGAVTQLILRALTGITPAYLEFYEFTEKSAIMGVPDYVPASIVSGQVTVMPNAFGSFGEGLLNVSKLKTGPVTISRLARSGSRFIMHSVKGEATTPETWEEAGWAPPAPQLPSLEVTFEGKADDFVSQVLGQHYILTYGNQQQRLAEYCRLNDIDWN